jgi:hypothetical protein
MTYTKKQRNEIYRKGIEPATEQPLAVPCDAPFKDSKQITEQKIL